MHRACKILKILKKNRKQLIITCNRDRVMALAFCTSSHCRLSRCEVSCRSLYFQTYAPDKKTSEKKKLGRELTLKLILTSSCFLNSTLSLIALYQCVNFNLVPFNTFRGMLRTEAGWTDGQSGDYMLIF